MSPTGTLYESSVNDGGIDFANGNTKLADASQWKQRCVVSFPTEAECVCHWLVGDPCRDHLCALICIVV